jgi:Rrf2 family protein
MKISRKAEYAIRALLILASESPQRTMQIQEMSKRGDIPVKFLEQILLTLRKAGMLHSKRGVGGGYRLDRPSRTISLGMVIQTIDGDLSTLGKLSHSPSGTLYPGYGGLQKCFDDADELINDYLLNRTIDEVLTMDQPPDSLAFDI